MLPTSPRMTHRGAAIRSSLVVLAIVAAGCGNKQTARAAPAAAPLTIEDILRIDQTGPPIWSPDGREVGFVWGPGTERDLWAADSAARSPGRPGAATLRQVAPLTGRAEPAVSPDWHQVAYVSKKQIWTVPLEGGRPVQLTKAEGKYSELSWSPDSTRLAFILERNDQDDIGVVAATGGPVTMIAATPHDEDSAIWSPNSDRLAFIRRPDDWKGYEIWVSAPDGTAQRSIVREMYDKGVEEFKFEGNASWSPDGKRLVYLSNRTGYNHVWTISADGGEPSELTKGAFVDYDPQWAPDGQRILFISSRGGGLEERNVWVVDASGGEPVRVSRDGLCASPRWSRDGQRIAYLRSSAKEPPEIVVQEPRAGGPVSRLTESRPDPGVTETFVEPQSVTYASKDGMNVHGIMLQPRGGENGSRPAILYFHGKSGINLKGWGGLPNYAFHQYLVQQGYAVMFVNWRGTHVGYGNEYERANYRDYAGGELDDVVAAAEVLKREAGADPKRIACWGGSYGGYMTMLAVTKASEVCSAGISLYGVSDWISFVKQNKRKLWRMRLLAKLGDPDKDRPLWERANPINFAAHAKAPLLILTGMDDDGVVPAQGESLHDAMQKMGKTVDFVAYVGEGHGFKHVGSERDLYNRTLAFLSKYNTGTKPGVRTTN
jgi:dipeptidyl aminopeptidase/acylaminoacyl peptidase